MLCASTPQRVASALAESAPVSMSCVGEALLTFHIACDSKSTRSETTDSDGEAQGGGGGRGGGGALAESSDTGGFLRSCRAAQQSSRELAGTVLMSIIGLAAASLARTVLNALIRMIARKRGKEVDGDPIPVLAWEVQVFLLQYQGLAESAGEAIASKCFGYEIAGALVLLVLCLVAGAVLALVMLAVRRRVIVWQKKSAKQAAIEMKDAFKDSKGTGIIHRFRVTYQAYIVFNDRGSWEPSDQDPDKEQAGTNILDRLGSFFDSSTGVAWWYGFWCLLKVITLGIVLAAFVTPEANAIAALVLSIVDSVFLVISRPQVQWMAFIQETYKAMVNLATLGSIVSYVSGNLPSNWFSNVFVVLSVVSIVPAAIASFLGPLVGAIQAFKTCVTSCGGLLSAQNLGAASGAGMAITAVATGDDAFQDQVLGALEREQPAENQPDGHGQDSANAQGREQYNGSNQFDNGSSQLNGTGTTVQQWQAPSVASPYPPQSNMLAGAGFGGGMSASMAFWNYEQQQQQQALRQTPAVPGGWARFDTSA